MIAVPRKRLLSVCVLGALAFGVSAAPALAPLSPKRAVLSGADGSVKTQRSTFCVGSENEPGEAGYAICADYASLEDPPRPRLRVDAGEELEIRFRHRDGVADKVTHASVGLIDFDGKAPYESIGKAIKAKHAGGKRWTFELPGDLDKVNGLSIFARLESGDASFFAGLRP